jgi:WD40 repeat protein
LVRTANNDGDLRTWEIDTGIKQFAGRESDTADHPTHAFAISREETFCVAVGFPTYVTLWDLLSGTKTRQFHGHTDRVVAVSISPDQTRAVTGSWDGTLRVWNLATGDSVQMIEPDIGKVLAVSHSPDGRLIAAAGRSWIVLLDAATGKKLRSLRGPRAYFNAVAFTSDSAFLASGDRENVAHVWRVADGELVRSFEGHTNWVNAVAISADDQLLLTGSSDRTARLWSLGTGELLREYVGHTKPVYAVAFRPQSREVVSGGEDDEVRFWAIPEEPIERQQSE